MRSILFFILISFCIHSNAQLLKAKGKMIVDDKGNEVLLRGIGLGGWMLQEPYMLQLSGIASNQKEIRQRIKELAGDENTERFYQAWLANHCTKADVDSLAAWGFNSVRLPMHYNLFTLPIEEEPVKGANTWLQKGFDLTDSLLSWCKANKLYLILDLHAAPGGQGSDIPISDRDTSKSSLWQSKLNQQKTIALWKKLAARYAKEKWIGAYDIINEPNWGFQSSADKNGCAEKENAPLRQLMKDITAAIREVDKQHLVIIEGNCWGNNYEGVFPLWDDNLAVSFHKYWNFTDQNSIQRFIDYREKYNVPIWMGESGENSNVWFTNAIELLEQNKIGWNWWPLKKLGINNPIQVIANKGFQNIISYWKGKGSKPSQEEATTAFMQLAKDVNIKNAVIRKDVIDAMFRQVHSAAVKPFKHHTIQSNAIVFAVDYDMGRSGYAYHDADTGNYWVSTTHRTDWNKGWSYRNDGVDIETCRDSITNGYSVGWISADEWLQYSVYAPQETSFNINVRSAAKEEGAIQLIVKHSITDAVLPSTGDHQNWQTTTIKNIQLQKGWNQLRIKAVKGGFNLNYLQFISTDSVKSN